MADTTISWTDRTWNPVTGCDRVSPGCDNCYALTLAKRLKAMEGKRIQLGKLDPGQAKYQNDGDPRTSGPGFKVTTHEDALTEPLRHHAPTKWFVPSMGDLFHAQVPDEFIARVFIVMALAGQHTFQIPTKRPKRMRDLLSSPRWRDLLQEADGWACRLDLPIPAGKFLKVRAWIYGSGDWRDPVTPLSNVWLGTSVENQKYASIRVPLLIARRLPATVRFLSCEPLLGPVDLSRWMTTGHTDWQCSGCLRFFTGPHRLVCPNCDRVGYWTGSHAGNGRPNGQPIGWVIAGGESGRGARPMHLDWARQLRDQCAAAGVPFHFKQLGTQLATELGIAGKGDDFDALPAEFQIREYPKGVTT
jgi:protein gp37